MGTAPDPGHFACCWRPRSASPSSASPRSASPLGWRSCMATARRIRPGPATGGRAERLPERTGARRTESPPWSSLGVYTGAADVSGVKQFADWLRIDLHRAVDFINGSTWSTIESPTRQTRGWANSGYRIDFGLPMIPASGGSLAAGARGAYNSHFVKLGENLDRERSGRRDHPPRMGVQRALVPVARRLLSGCVRRLLPPDRQLDAERSGTAVRVRVEPRPRQARRRAEPSLSRRPIRRLRRARTSTTRAGSGGGGPGRSLEGLHEPALRASLAARLRRAARQADDLPRVGAHDSTRRAWWRRQPVFHLPDGSSGSGRTTSPPSTTSTSTLRMDATS